MVRVAVISGPGDLGVVPQYTNKPQEYAQFVAAEQAKWGRIVTAIGFKEQN